VSAPPLPAAVILGTRGSALARAQAALVAELLTEARPGLECSTKVIATAGDRSQASGQPLPEIGGKGLFTMELERGLAEGEIDVAVHSLKDLPTEDAPGVTIGAVCAREDVRDCVVSRGHLGLDAVPEGAVVGTSSLRRVAQLRRRWPHLDVRSIRGNVDTRVRKVRDGEFDAVVLAAAGVRRLGLDHEVTEWLPVELMLPAPGQGALAVQCRAGDPVLELLVAIDDDAARASTTAERVFLRELGAGCTAPVAAYAEPTSDTGSRGVSRVRLWGIVASRDGAEWVEVSGEGEPAEVGARVAALALEEGADHILAAIRG
jgi:hydroxymethylbilane synthase